MKLCLISHDLYHPGDIPAKGLSPLVTALGYEMTVVMDAVPVLDILSNYAVVILSQSNPVNASTPPDSHYRITSPTPERSRTLTTYTESGGGLLVIHSGMAGYQHEPIFTKLIGGVFTGHPEACPVTMMMLKEHPITRGVENFTEMDEHYQVDVTAQDADIFMVTVSEHGAQTGGYTRRTGRGRVCVLTPGHNQAVWLNPNNQTMLTNAIRWCAGV